MRLHGWTEYNVKVYMDPSGHFEAIVSRSSDEDAWRGEGNVPIEAIEAAFRSIGRE